MDELEVDTVYFLHIYKLILFHLAYSKIFMFRTDVKVILLNNSRTNIMRPEKSYKDVAFSVNLIPRFPPPLKKNVRTKTRLCFSVNSRGFYEMIC